MGWATHKNVSHFTSIFKDVNTVSRRSSLESTEDLSDTHGAQVLLSHCENLREFSTNRIALIWRKKQHRAKAFIMNLRVSEWYYLYLT